MVLNLPGDFIARIQVTDYPRKLVRVIAAKCLLASNSTFMHYHATFNKVSQHLNSFIVDQGRSIPLEDSRYRELYGTLGQGREVQGFSIRQNRQCRKHSPLPWFKFGL